MLSALIQKLKEKLFICGLGNSKSALSQFFMVSGSTLVAQAVSVLMMPVLAKLYFPDDFGIAATFASIVAILCELTGGRYYFAIPNPKSDRYAKALVYLSFLLQISFISIISFSLAIIGDSIFYHTSMVELIPYKWLIPIGLFITGTYTILSQWAIREGLFLQIAKVNYLQALIGAFLKTFFGLLDFKPVGLLIGGLFAQAAGFAKLTFSLSKSGLPLFSKTDLKRVALRYRNFPMYGTLGGLLNTMGGNVASIMLFSLNSPKAAGLFALGSNVIRLPSALFGNSIGQVFMQRAAMANNSGSLIGLTDKAYRGLLALGTFPTIMIGIMAPKLFSFVFGAEWYEAGVYSRYLAVGLIFSFIYSTLSPLIGILEKQKEYTYFQFLALVGRVVAIFAGFYFFNRAVVSIALYGLFESIFYFSILFWLLQQAGMDYKKSIYIFLSYLSKGLLLALPSLCLAFFNADFSYLLLAGFVTTPFYVKGILRQLG